MMSEARKGFEVADDEISNKDHYENERQVKTIEDALNSRVIDEIRFD